MKRILLLILIVGIFSACELLYQPVEYPEIPVIDGSAWIHVLYFAIEIDTTEVYREVQNDPGETWAARNGDCFEKSILDLYAIKRDLGIEGSLMTGWRWRSDGTGYAHAWLEVDGIWFDAVTGRCRGDIGA